MKLTARERKGLIRLEKQIPRKGASTRIRIIPALDPGHTAKEAAKLFLPDEDTITQWKQRYGQSRYLSDWLGTKNNGWQGKLTREQEEMIEKYVKDNVITDCRQVVELIQNTIGINYTVDGITRLLHRLGFVYKQVTGIPGKPSGEKQMAFVKAYEELKEKMREGEVILFGDGVHPTHNPHKTKARIKKGGEKQVKTSTGRGRLNIHGVLNPETMEATVHYSGTINAQITMEFFDELQIKYAHMRTVYLNY